MGWIPAWATKPPPAAFPTPASPTVKKFMCNFCKKEYARSYLKKHIENIHGKNTNDAEYKNNLDNLTNTELRKLVEESPKLKKKVEKISKTKKNRNNEKITSSNRPNCNGKSASKHEKISSTNDMDRENRPNSINAPAECNRPCLLPARVTSKIRQSQKGSRYGFKILGCVLTFLF